MKPVTLTHEELSQLIGLVYASAFETPQWQRLLKRMTELYPGSNSVVFVHDNGQILPLYNTGRMLPDDLVSSHSDVDFLNYKNENAMVSMLSAPNGYIARSRKENDEDTYFASNFYKTRMKPNGLKHYMAVKLDSHNNRGACLCFAISDDPVLEEATHDPMFETLKLLSPHLVQALRLSRALSMSRNALSVMGGVLDAIVLPMLVVTDRAEFVFANAAGQRLLNRGRPARLSDNGQLVMDQSHHASLFSEKLRHSGDIQGPSGMRIEQESGSLSLCVTPFRPAMSEVNAMDRDLLQEEKLFAVFIGQEGKDRINTQLLQDAFDLTAREAEICGALVVGQSPSEIAERSGRSLKTVRNQIQVVHEKVGVSSNAALIEAMSVFRTVGAVMDASLSQSASAGSLTH